MPPDFAAHWSIEEIGTLDKVAFTGELPPQRTSDFTLTFWYFAVNAASTQVIANVDDWLHLLIADHQLILRLNTLELAVPCSDLKTWHHVAVVADSARAQFYVDGQLVQSGRLTNGVDLSTQQYLRIGGYTDPAGGHFDHTFGRGGTGWVDNVCWYDSALSSTDIAKLIPTLKSLPDVQIHVGKLENGTVKLYVTDAKSDDFYTFIWDFGDGESAFGGEVTHSYVFSGEYRIRLTALTPGYQQVTLDQTIAIEGETSPLNVTPVFTNGTEGYACYRIPSIVRAQNGDLIAFAEGRVESCSDSTDTIRLVSKRSTDNGQTWSPLRVVVRNLVDGQEHVVQNCSPVVDSRTGRIIAVYNKLQHSEWELAAGKGKSHTFVSFSDDNGTSWHSEKDITQPVQRSNWQVQRPTLGHAIQLKCGRLFFAGVFTEGQRSVFQSQNYAFWTDDGGDTWTIGGIVPTVGLNEAIAVELENGDVMINSRAYKDEKSVGRRAVTIGRFIGADEITFEPTTVDETLIDPAVQASLIRYTTSQQSKSRILFCNPNHPQARYNLTVRLSYDEGQTWAFGKTIDAGPSSYCDLVIQDDMNVGVLYERGNQGGIVYTNFSLAWLTDGQDSIG